MICLKMVRLSGTELSTHIIKTSINHGSDILFLPFLGTRILGDKQKMNILISILGPYLIQDQSVSLHFHKIYNDCDYSGFVICAAKDTTIATFECSMWKS